jgi:TolB-like protein/tRNA A-37 threonylcarbamoyl transferase component Bud32/tetratricopeptide (TPR) repeat protein
LPRNKSAADNCPAPGSLPLIGRTLSHYRLTAAIGAGGMGEVYRATDTKLGREIALKVLPSNMARDPERLARFQREARAVAALNHPHIVTIFSVEEADGVHFLTMELVEGQSLDHRITEGGLPIEQIVEIAGALAEALSAAHERGIVHRDLKPANVMVTDEGRVKVLDFGLAKEIHPAEPRDVTLTSAECTKMGVVMGTPAYMSPEQIAGRALDERTDIFSLGIILYEMASGRRPFEGASSAELASAILRDTPRPLSELRPELPEGLGRVIQCCLEKNAADRFPSARDLRSQLRGVTAEAPSIRKATDPASRPVAETESVAARAAEGFWVAVLPFKYAGANAELTALAEGFTEDIVTGLSRFSYLRVIARSSTLRYAHGEVDVRAVGKELGARYVMEGSLRQAGSRLRIAVQLVDASSGAHLWAETYDRIFPPGEIFTLQDDLVPRIVSTVADTYGVLPHNMSEALRNRDPKHLTPHEAVLRSFAHFPRLSAEEHAAARAGLERAVQQAPGYADGWAMLSMMYREEYTHQFNVRPDPVGRALAAARRAVEAAPSNHLAYHALASAQFFRRELQAFRNSAERAVALNPMDGFTAAYLGFLIAYAGDWERGCALVERARGLNPHHPGWYWFPSFFDAYRKSDYRTALDIALKVNMPGFWRTNFALATVYGQLGEREAACDAVRELLALRPDFPVVAREELAKWWDPELVEHLIDGLRKAGLEISGEELGAQPRLPTP